MSCSCISWQPGPLENSNFISAVLWKKSTENQTWFEGCAQLSCCQVKQQWCNKCPWMAPAPTLLYGTVQCKDTLNLENPQNIILLQTAINKCTILYSHTKIQHDTIYWNSAVVKKCQCCWGINLRSLSKLFLSQHSTGKVTELTNYRTITPSQTKYAHTILSSPEMMLKHVETSWSILKHVKDRISNQLETSKKYHIIKYQDNQQRKQEITSRLRNLHWLICWQVFSSGTLRFIEVLACASAVSCTLFLHFVIFVQVCCQLLCSVK